MKTDLELLSKGEMLGFLIREQVRVSSLASNCDDVEDEEEEASRICLR